jgi:hypothetical protein
MAPRKGAGAPAGVSRLPRQAASRASWVQLDLFAPPARPVCGSPSLTAAIRLADALAEAHRWPGEVRRRVRQGLAITLAGRQEGQDVQWSQIRRGVERWLRTLKDGGSRSRPRSVATVHSHLAKTPPALSDWSARYHHLREVTREDIEASLHGLHGSHRHNALVALRLLFGFCVSAGVIFRNPARGIKVGRRPATTVIQPLGRPLDDLTARLLRAWLENRRTRWPGTANPHLLINTQTALGTGSASRTWVSTTLRGHAVTVEALATGADPLHLAATSGLDPGTAIRYASSARHLLQAAAEQQDPAGSPRTQGPDPPTQPEDP